MKARSLTDRGIECLRSYICSLRTNDASPPPDILEDSEFTTELAHDVDVPRRTLASRFELAEFLFGMLGDVKEVERKAGLWAWLSLYLFDQVCPPSLAGRRKAREDAAYLLDTSYKRYYRHLLAGPFLIYKAHRDAPTRAMALLCRPVHVVDEIVAQIAAYEELVTNPTVVETATVLYYDATAKSPKRGSQGKGPGSPRRFVTITEQFDRTFDIYSMGTQSFLAMLPAEFGRFLPFDRTAAR